MDNDASFRPFLVAGLALVICAVGDACTRQDATPVAEAAPQVIPAIIEERPTAPPSTPTTAAPTTAAPTSVAPTTAAHTTAPAPEVTAAPEPEPEAAGAWDGACGPNDPIPASATAVTSALLDAVGQGLEGTATTYLDGGRWFLRFDGPVISDEMQLDASPWADVRVAAGVDLSGFGAHDVLVATGEDGPFTELELFGNHDGCLFRYEEFPGVPLRFRVGVDDHQQTMFGVTCHSDEWGSFITSRTAVNNGDDTWNTYGTSYTWGSPFELEASDGGHSFGVPDGHSTLDSFANVWCGDAELGEF